MDKLRAVSDRAARGRLRDPRSVRTTAFPGTPPRALAAIPTRAGSVGRRADVARRDDNQMRTVHVVREIIGVNP